MKRLVFFIALFLVAGWVSANEFEKLIGTWNYKVEYAPEGYDKGQMVFTMKEGKPAGEVKLEGYSIQVKNLVFAEGEYKFGVETEYGYIPITIKVDGDKLTGKASTPDGDLPIAASKVKTE